MAAARPMPKPGPPGERWLRRSVGLSAVYRKEFADHTSGLRFPILVALVLVAGVASVYVAARTLSETLAQMGENDPFVFLKLFTTGGNSLPSFTFFLGFLGPLLGIALGFDAVNGERLRGTLSRLVSQPIHRDAIINGKFLSALAVITVVIFSLGGLVAGMGLRLIGVAPRFEEFLRVVVYLAVTVVYVGFWLSVAILFSTVLRQTVASALASLAAWLFFSIFAGLLFGLVADAVAPVRDPQDAYQVLRNAQWNLTLNRFSPALLYAEAVQTLLNPEVRALGPLFLEQVWGAIPGAPLPLGQSLLLVWPHLTGLAAATLVCFWIAYVSFMRQEVRPTPG